MKAPPDDRFAPSCAVALASRGPRPGPLVLLAVALAIALLPAVAPAAEAWTDSTGSYQVDADFLALRGDTVYLRKTNGVTIAVPLDRLSPQSQQRARQLAAAPAETDDTPDAAMRALMTNIELGELGAAWEALPASYQNDVNDVVRLFAENMDRDLWNAGTRILEKAVAVLNDQRSFILGYVAQRVETDADAMGEGLDAVAALLETIVKSELGDLERLKTFDGGVFLAGTGTQIGARVAALSQTLEEHVDPAMVPLPAGFPGMEMMRLTDFDKIRFTTVQSDRETAILRVEQDGEVEDHEMVRVDGKWLPREMVDGWAEGISEMKEALTTDMPQQLQEAKQMLLSPLSPLKTAEVVLDQLAAARSQDEFNQVIDGILEMVGQLVGQMMGLDDAGFPANGDPFPLDDPFGMPEDAPAPFGEPDGGADPFDAAPDDSEPGEIDPFGA